MKKTQSEIYFRANISQVEKKRKRLKYNKVEACELLVAACGI